jgi:hypothetical protein
MVLTELLKIQDENCKKPKHRYLFRGKSCFPISPANPEDNTVMPNDQIFEVMKHYPNFVPKIDFNFISSP